MSDSPVSVERLGDIALICIDHPPVNATGVAVRQGLWDAIDEVNAMGVDVAALYCAGRTFVAGADIREFGKPPKEPHLPAICRKIATSQVPIVAIMHGTALGGGFELGLASAYRVGLEGLRVGLPEVLIGVLPGAGGTIRLPKLAGVAAALDASLSGRQIPAAEALELGIIDRIMDGDPREIAEHVAGQIARGEQAMRRTDEIEITPDPEAIAAARASLQKKAKHLYSPHAIVDCIEYASGHDVEEAMTYERQRFWDCMETPQRAGLIHAFFGERAVANIPEKSATPREVNAIGVIGGGTMGSGIATSALLAGLKVTLIERDQQALDRGAATIAKNLDGAEKRGKLKADKRAKIDAALSTSTDMGALSDADLIIEAVFEDMAVKKEIFTQLDGIAKAGAILASNTSYLDVNEIASVTKRPEDVLGLHFFSPAHVMRLLEVVVASETADEVVATGFALARRMGKIAVRAEVCDGFIGNRILAHYSKSAAYMVMDGASPQQVDDALEGFGFAMGPHRVGDLAGLDIGWANRKRLADQRPSNERYAGKVADRICEGGDYGRKTGKGYYVYEDGREAGVNPALQGILDEVRDGPARDWTDEDIVDRYMTAMISEAARVVEDGIALRPVDVDQVFLHGYGFPRFRGGPLHYADTIGAKELVRRIETYAEEDPHYWQVPAILYRMAEDGTTFAQMNEGK